MGNIKCVVCISKREIGGDLMNRFILVLVMIAGLSIAGCSGNNAKELFETAQFEELQNNRDHAIKLYREIIEKDREGEYAGKARKRLDVLKQTKH
jgi:hypothetical protein